MLKKDFGHGEPCNKCNIRYPLNFNVSVLFCKHSGVNLVFLKEGIQIEREKYFAGLQ